MDLKKSQLMFRALADETRLRILHLLSKGELCVCDVMNVLKQPQSKVSRHFAYLRRAGLVTGRKEGLWMYYRLSPGQSKVHRALNQILEVAGQELPELKKDSCERTRKNKSLVACCK
jgi:ArsR family transcriptional regulator, arsenate/arsenite/antimonite-responsive transcriptional repressor